MKHPKAACKWLDLLIVVVAMQVLGLTNASAFYLWPLRRTRATGTNNMHSQEPSMIRHRAAAQATPTSTSTTTTTTTQIPPIELLFEINPEDLNQQQRQPELSEDPSELALQSANGTLILEDLVNQFERNFNLKSHAQALNLRTQSNRSAHYVSSSTETSPESSTLAFTQSTESAAPGLASEWLSRQQSDSLVETPDPRDLDLDRHIQYDTLTSTAEFTQQQQNSRHDKQARPIITSSSGRLLLDYKAADDQVELNQTIGERSDMNQPLEDNAQNLTLKPIGGLDFDFQLPTLVVSKALSNVSGDLPSSPSQDSPTRNETIAQLQASSSPINLRASNSSQIQARSMSAGSSTSRLPQHTKPPYASYNQFHQRPDHQAVSSDLKRPAQTSDDPTKAIGVVSGDVSTVLGNQTIATGTATTTGNKLESTRTATSTTTSTTSTTTPRPPTLVPKLQDYLTNGFSQLQDNNSREELERVATKLAPANELIELSPLPSVPSKDQSQPPTAISERHFTSRNGGPSGSSLHVQVYQDSNHPGSRYQNDRLAVSDSQLGGGSTMDTISRLEGNYQQLSLNEPANQMLTISRVMSSSFAPETPGGGSSQTAHDVRNGIPLVVTNRPSSMHNNLDSNQDPRSQFERNPLDIDSNRSPPVPLLHKKTIETLSSQIQHSDSNHLMGQSSNTYAVHQHKERSPPAQVQPQVLHRDANSDKSSGGTYAASLINVTAPMMLPLSATEAMEASLDDDLAARHQMMHRVGGGNVMTGGNSEEQASDKHSIHHNEGPTSSAQMQAHKLNGHTYYPIPGASSPDDHLHSHHSHRRHPLQSIYSRPESQFRQTPTTTHSPAAQFGSNQPGEASSTMSERDRMRLGDSFLTSSPSPPPVTSGNSQQASGFRSPLGYYPTASTLGLGSIWPPHLPGRTTGLPMPSNYLNELAASAVNPAAPSFSTTTTTISNKYQSTTQATPASSSISPQNRVQNSSPSSFSSNKQNSTLSSQQHDPTTSNDFIIGSVANATAASNSGQQTDLMAVSTGNTNGSQLSQQMIAGIQPQQPGTGADKRVFNLTRVEHISAECSSDMIRAIIIFNGTFKGIIYASGYVRDPNCLFINGTGKTRYDFSIKLNQCGTVGRNEIHPAAGPNEVRRRDQVMYNSLSIQYNPIIEQEWDEHFRVSCEYGSDFWKTISFSPFNVQTNTDSPVVFTVDPPQCQMEILKGHGMVGPRQEAVSGPVTVGDPLTLLIHMKSEKAGYDILVKNCIAHNGGQQKMQLIDANGCVVNERFISPFRGTYNDNDLKHVTLYSYLKAFRFTGSPVLYLECEVHMCQSACPPQMCYWRRLSKRSAHHNESRFLASDGADEFVYGNNTTEEPPARLTEFNFTATTTSTEPSTTTVRATSRLGRQRRGRKMPEEREQGKKSPTQAESSNGNLSDKVSLFQALEVRQERDPNSAASTMNPYEDRLVHQQMTYNQQQYESESGGLQQLVCYQRAEIFAFLFTVASVLFAAISVTIGCYYRASSLKRQALNGGKKQHPLSGATTGAAARPLSLSSANLCYSPISPAISSSSASSPPCSLPENRPSHPRAANNKHPPYLASFLLASDKPTKTTLYGPPSTITTSNGKSLLQTPVSSLGAFLKQHHHEQEHRRGPVPMAKRQ